MLLLEEPHLTNHFQDVIRTELPPALKPGDVMLVALCRVTSGVHHATLPRTSYIDRHLCLGILANPSDIAITDQVATLPFSDAVSWMPERSADLKRWRGALAFNDAILSFDTLSWKVALLFLDARERAWRSEHDAPLLPLAIRAGHADIRSFCAAQGPLYSGLYLRACREFGIMTPLLTSEGTSITSPYWDVGL